MHTTYEIMLLLSAKQSEKTLNKSISDIKAGLESIEAKIILAEDWGKRLLTYPIKDEEEAYFHYIQFQIAASKISSIKENLRHKEGILRFLITKLPDNYQTREGQHLVEIVNDIINFGEEKSKTTSSLPIPNPDKAPKPKVKSVKQEV